MSLLCLQVNLDVSGASFPLSCWSSHMSLLCLQMNLDVSGSSFPLGLTDKKNVMVIVCNYINEFVDVLGVQEAWGDLGRLTTTTCTAQAIAIPLAFSSSESLARLIGLLGPGPMMPFDIERFKARDSEKERLREWRRLVLYSALATRYARLSFLRRGRASMDRAPVRVPPSLPPLGTPLDSPWLPPFLPSFDSSLSIHPNHLLARCRL